MNEERYILAELKRWLVKQEKYMNGKDVLCRIAEIEADAVLGEEIELEPEPEDEEAEA